MIDPTKALVDQLRALPPTIAAAALAQLGAELGPEAIGALGLAWDFWRRPSQRFPTDAELLAYHTVVYTGDFGTGKTRCGWELLSYLVISQRVGESRIVASTGAAAREIVTGETGILAWRKPGVGYDWQISGGYEGELRINGTLISLCTVEAPKTLTGSGRSAELLDDPPKWGPSGKNALVNAMRSTREPGAISIIPTTAEGLALIAEVNGTDEAHLGDVGVLVIDIGRTEDNHNLDPKVLVKRANLRRAGLWDAVASVSPWAVLTPEQWRAMRLEVCPPLVEMCISLDPAKGASLRPCEHGIIGGGRDARSVVHTRHDRSAVLDAGVRGWPAVAWDLAVDMQREHPGVRWHFLFESNVGRDRAELLNGEERARRRRGEPVPLPEGGWADARVRAEVNGCEIRFTKANRDKCARAESPARQAAQGQVKHAPRLDKLEGQQRNLSPMGTDSDGADAENHMIADLLGLAATTAPDPVVLAARASAGIASANRGMPRPAFAPGRV